VEKTQQNSHNTVQGHSRSPILVTVKSSQAILTDESFIWLQYTRLTDMQSHAKISDTSALTSTLTQQIGSDYQRSSHAQFLLCSLLQMMTDPETVSKHHGS